MKNGERSNMNSDLGPNIRKITLLTIFAMIGVVISGAALLSSYNLGQVAAQQATSNAQLSLSMLKQKGVPLLGSPSAHITIIEFADFQCPFCARFAKDIQPQINQTYIQTGKVNMAYVHFTKFGPDSVTAAMAAQCAKDQGKFWNFYNILFKNQGAEDSGWASKDNLKKFALQIPGLDTQKFNTCLDSGKYVSLVQNHLAFGTSLKVPEIPAFIIEKSDGSNLDYLPGAYPFPAFQALIDKKLTGG
jgi:protein-disulfide isomerase